VQWLIHNEKRRYFKLKNQEILLICTGNTCRSAMAEGILRKIIDESGRKGFSVYSAGMAAFNGAPATEGAQLAAARMGIDLGAHRSSPLSLDRIMGADYILVMESFHRDAVLHLAPGAEYKCSLLSSYGPDNIPVDIPDPIGAQQDIYNQCSEILFECLKGFVLTQLKQKESSLLAAGSDHRGFEMKELLLTVGEKSGWETLDCGAFSTQKSDYPDISCEVGRLLMHGRAQRGLLVCGSGIGMDIAVNKISGVRGALCLNLYMAEICRKHNDANVLILGSDLVSKDEAQEILRLWLKTDFDGERHQRRLDKIDQYDAYMKNMAGE
jgi:ribose 5-phosphate isomerase B